MGRKYRIEVGLVQVAVRTDDESWSTVERLIDRVQGVDLVILPELWNVGYFDFSAWIERAELLHGPTFKFLRDMARKLDAFVLGGSFIEKEDGRYYNTAIFIDPSGNLLGKYRKRHLLSYKSKEREILTPGSEPLVVPTEIGTFGTAICYDLRFPKLFREMAGQGAEVFLVPAAWPIVRMEAWEALTRARAVENQAFLLGCDVSGKGFLGRSVVVDPEGVVIGRLGGGEGVLRAELDLARMRAFREEFSAWQER